MTQLRLNFVLQGLTLNGGVKVILKVAGGLSARGHEVVVSGLGPVTSAARAWLDPGVSLRAEQPRAAWRRATLKVLRTASGVNLADDDEAMHLRQLVRPDMVNVATAWRTAYAVAWAQDPDAVAVYYMQHDESLFERDPTSSRKARLSHYLPYRHIANSRWLAERVRRAGQPPAPVVLPGVEQEVFHRLPKQKPTDGPVILTFCDRRTWKGYDDVLDAFEIVARERPDVRFHAYGRSPAHRIPSTYRIAYHLAPHGPELADLYRQSSLFVLGSWYESSPLQPLEALSCGTPVVSTPVGVEDWARDGENVLLAPPRSPSALARRVLDALESPGLLERIAEDGHATAQEFTWERTVDQAEEAFTKLVSRAS